MDHDGRAPGPEESAEELPLERTLGSAYGSSPVVPGDPATRLPRLPRALAPFGRRQYRRLIGALSLSMLGGGMWLVAIVFQVVELGGGPGELSLVAAGSSVGLVVTALFGGVLADRVPQRHILLVVEIVKTLLIAGVAALALTGGLDLAHLVLAATLFGATEGFFYPAYSALLPAILPGEELLAANGVEGMLRPAAMQAAGPAAASAAIAVGSPGLAFAVVAAAQLVAAVALWFVHATPVRREFGERQHPVRAVFADLADGVRYMLRTPWFLGTLIFACLFVLALMGPIEVLLPFAVIHQAGGGAGEFALVLTAFGFGGIAGSLLTASLRFPRRYLSIMYLAWGAGAIPLAIIGFTDQLWVMMLALAVVGFAFSAGQVIWGTLLQRRVPPAYLGRVSSLDFFVSLALMPVSMALAGPVGEAIGLAPAFLVAGLAPVVIALVTLVVARIPRDEIEHPLPG